eukprot:scaffold3505_cov170-Amphora_coffeaeformis.AAC.16
MAHNVNGNAVQNLAQQHQNVPPPQANASASGSGGPSAWIGHDVMDRQQKSLSLNKIKSVAHLPMVALDLYASQPMVAYFPPRSEDTVNCTDRPILVGKMKSHVALKATEASHKVVRKWLTQSKPFSAVKADVLTTDKDNEAVLLERPFQWLGMRRLAEAPEFLQKDESVLADDSGASHAIAEESTEVGARWMNATLDGKSDPAGDDFDRVICRLRLATTKKALTLLPEEATQIMLHQAQYHVAGQTKVSEEDEICSMPTAIAVPAYAMHDGAMESLMDACQAMPGGTGTLLPRALCALAGALSLDPQSHKYTAELLQRVQKVREHRQKAFRSEHPEPGAHLEDTQQWILLGSTPDGVEATAVVVGEFQLRIACPIGSMQMQSHVSYQSSNPIDQCSDAINGLHAALERMALEEGPAGILVYGTEQEALTKAWHATTKGLDDDWKKLPLFRATPEAVPLGAALLGAISHGRLAIESTSTGGGKKKTKVDLALRTQWVAPVAVGMAFHYKYTGKSKKTGWTPVKEIFGFDRRVPAGPFAVECKASDCVVHREGKVNHDDDEAFLKASKDMEGSKHIPLREQAALEFRVQIYQKWTRDGEWKPLGDPLEPLVELSKDEKRIACEAVSLEVSLSATGMVSTLLVGERESVKQATKTARWNYIQNAIAIGLAVLFFGGFFVKSWWEEYVLNRDTRRLLAYYKRAVPGSIHDGDEGTARWLVYKYSGKKEKLWQSLEKKYGIPVLHADEWPESEEGGEEEPEIINFDDEAKPDDGSKSEKESNSNEEPDL